MHLFTRTWAALHAAVAALSAEDFTRPSGCRGWLVRDLVCHLIVNAQDVLITLVTPAGTAPTHDAITYWTVTDEPPTGEDPGDAVTVRLAAAYGDPALLRAHLDDVGSAAGRAAELADLGLAVSTQDMVLTVDDFLMVYALEWTLHHLDLIAHVPGAEPPPPPRGWRGPGRCWRRSPGRRSRRRSRTRTSCWWRRVAVRQQEAEAAELGDLAARLPFVLG